MNKCFHGLERSLVGFFVSHLFGKLLGVLHRFGVKSLGKFVNFSCLELFIRHERCDHAHFSHFAVELLHHRLDFFFGLARQEHESLDHVRKVSLAVRDANAVCHGVIEVRHGLSTVLVVLVTLNSDSGQGGVAADILRFAQVTVTRVEAVLEQLNEVNLAAGHRKRIEVKVMDVNVTIHVGAAVFRLEHHHRVEVLSGFGTVLEHGTHGSIAIDIGIFALEVGFLGRAERNVMKRLHEASVDFTDAGTFGTVQDIALGGIGVTTFGQSLFNSILNFFDVRLGLIFGFQVSNSFGSNLESDICQKVIVSKQIHLSLGCLDLFIQFAGGSKSLDYGVCNLLDVERHLAAVALFDSKNHLKKTFNSRFLKYSQNSSFLLYLVSEVEPHPQDVGQPHYKYNKS